jgi:Uma2 family endonuclease
MALTRVKKPVIPSVAAIDYPDSDGKPLGETGVHLKVAVLDLLDVIQRYYDGNLDVAVQSNMFVYYVEGDSTRVVCPDLFVALGVPSDITRRSYKVWIEGKVPDLTVEVTSKKTRRVDQGKKFELYRDVLKVREYFLFDPFEEYLKPSLQGYRLLGGAYEPIAKVEGRLPSEVLDLHIERARYSLRLFNPRTGLWQPTARELEEVAATSEAKSREAERARREAEAARREAETARQEAEAATQEAEAEIQRLRGELESLRKRRHE